MRTFLQSVVILILSGACTALACNDHPSPETGGKTMEIIIKSSAFNEGELIPIKYTCDGINVSPPLSWSDSPQGTKSFALISDDPDAPMGTWVHWVIYNIPPDINELPENMPSSRILPNGAIQGVTDFGSTGYGGPCPPSGTHRYYFKIYALDTILDLNSEVRKKQLVEAMEDHIIDQGQLMGKYKRQR